MESFYLWPDQPALSILLLWIGSTLFLWAARTPLLQMLSDLREDLPAGVRREMHRDEFSGIHLVAMNVKRLGADSADPERYRQRLDGWRSRIEGAGGAGWQIVTDASKLGGVLEGLRS